MARVRTNGIVPHYHHPRYKSAPGEIASRVYPHLAEETDLAVARWRRQAFDNDLRYVDHVLRSGVDVGEEPPVQPRRQLTDAAYALWGREQEREANEVARQEVAQRLYEQQMKHWGSSGPGDDDGLP